MTAICTEHERKGDKDWFGKRGMKVRKMASRKEVAEEIGVGERQLHRYLKLASQHLKVFSNFMDSAGKLTGMPIETDEQIERLKLVRSLVVKYRNFKGKAKMIQLELEKYNQGDSNV